VADIGETAEVSEFAEVVTVAESTKDPLNRELVEKTSRLGSRDLIGDWRGSNFRGRDWRRIGTCGRETGTHSSCFVKYAFTITPKCTPSGAEVCGDCLRARLSFNAPLLPGIPSPGQLLAKLQVRKCETCSGAFPSPLRSSPLLSSPLLSSSL
jgi:hypothetical protein